MSAILDLVTSELGALLILLVLICNSIFGLIAGRRRGWGPLKSLPQGTVNALLGLTAVVATASLALLFFAASFGAIVGCEGPCGTWTAGIFVIAISLGTFTLLVIATSMRKQATG